MSDQMMTKHDVCFLMDVMENKIESLSENLRFVAGLFTNGDSSTMYDNLEKINEDIDECLKDLIAISKILRLSEVSKHKIELME